MINPSSSPRQLTAREPRLVTATRPYNHAVVIRLAAQALMAAQLDDLELAADYVKSAAMRGGLLTCVAGWCDTLIAIAHPHYKRGQPMRLAWIADDGKDVINWDVDTVRPTAAWAGRVIAARAAMDEAQFLALMSAPAEGADLGAHIVELLSMVAISLNNVAKVA